MAYEELTVYAIQRTDILAFGQRFRPFHTQVERDETLAFIKENQDARTVDTFEPVTLRVIVETDRDRPKQLGLDIRG